MAGGGWRACVPTATVPRLSGSMRRLLDRRRMLFLARKWPTTPQHAPSPTPRAGREGNSESDRPRTRLCVLGARSAGSQLMIGTAATRRLPHANGCLFACKTRQRRTHTQAGSRHNLRCSILAGAFGSVGRHHDHGGHQLSGTAGTHVARPGRWSVGTGAQRRGQPGPGLRQLVAIAVSSTTALATALAGSTTYHAHVHKYAPGPGPGSSSLCGYFLHFTSPVCIQRQLYGLAHAAVLSCGPRRQRRERSQTRTLRARVRTSAKSCLRQPTPPHCAPWPPPTRCASS